MNYKLLTVLVLLIAGVSCRFEPKSDSGIYHAPNPAVKNDSELLDIVQRSTFNYFWKFAHPVSGMARERSNEAYDYGNEVVTTGGTGFGIMAIVVATERNWITREEAVNHLLKMVKFLDKANHYHGIFPHWLNGETGKTIPFSRKDDGGDVVESAYLFQGLLTAREYFNANNDSEKELRNRITWLWEGAEWNWYTNNEKKLYWHWSPNQGWAMNMPIRGWNECLIAYVMAASSPRYAIAPEIYHECWTKSDYFYNGKTYYGITLPLGFDYGGPLFFSQYSFLGLDPHGLKDKYADYWEQNLAHTRINYSYCVENPKKFEGYGPNCWGLTSSDSYKGYEGHSPTNDHGVISPTAALSAFPYTPNESMAALKHFYNDLGKDIYGKFGFVDAFDIGHKWQAKSYLAIDQGPIVVMMENYRTQLLWKNFMKSEDIKRGLTALGFQSPYLIK